MIFTTSLLGMAKPIPSTLISELSVEVEAILLELIPMTWPAIFTNGPPEFPGLIAASVWMALILTPLVLSEIGRSTEEMIPEVTEFAYWEPSGEPMAIAGSPTFNTEESPKVAVSSTFSEEILITAKSVTESVPMSSPLTLLPSDMTTSNPSEPSTTWLLVTT